MAVAVAPLDRRDDNELRVTRPMVLVARAASVLFDFFFGRPPGISIDEPIELPHEKRDSTTGIRHARAQLLGKLSNRGLARAERNIVVDVKNENIFEARFVWAVADRIDTARARSVSGESHLLTRPRSRLSSQKRHKKCPRSRREPTLSVNLCNGSCGWIHVVKATASLTVRFHSAVKRLRFVLFSFPRG